MNKITFPLKIQMKRDAVADLHDGLRTLGFLIADKEKETKKFGGSTRDAVKEFQIQSGLESTGIVDENTAELINLRIARKTAPGKTPFPVFSLPLSKNTRGRPVKELQTGLVKLGFVIPDNELEKSVFGEGTSEAVKQFQKTAGIVADGSFSGKTIPQFQREMEHAFFTRNKTRTEQIHVLLDRLGQKISEDEKTKRTFGKSTGEAISRFQKAAGLPADGKATGDVVNTLKDEVLKARLSSKTQRGQIHHTLVRALRIAKIDVRIDQKELKDKTFGTTTAKAIKAFQEKYHLEITGHLDRLTLEHIQTMAASRPVKTRVLKVRSPETVAPVRRTLRLNMISGDVGTLQQDLAFLGYTIDESEFRTKTFGRTTREAVIAFQKKRSLDPTGHVEAETRKVLNNDLRSANPKAFDRSSVFHVRGTVRDEFWKGIYGLKVQVWEKTFDDTGRMLQERKTLPNGFFDIPYNPPLNPLNGQIKTPFNLIVKVLDTNNPEPLKPRDIFSPPRIAWVNFTRGDEPYRGISEYQKQMNLVSKALNGTAITDIELTDRKKDIAYLASNTGLSRDDIFRLVLSSIAAKKLNNKVITPEVFYAFIRQNLPPGLPGNFLAVLKQVDRVDDRSGPDDEEQMTVDSLVDITINGLILMDKSQQQRALDSAKTANLVPISVFRNTTTILETLTTLRREFTLTKPILTNNGMLTTLLTVADINAADKTTVIADIYSGARGFTPGFWEELKKQAGSANSPISTNDIQTLETSVTLGSVTLNHERSLKFLKSHLDNQADITTSSGTYSIRAARDFAKLNTEDWKEVLKDNHQHFPDLPEAKTSQEKINLHAVQLKEKFSTAFPTVALIADTGRIEKGRAEKEGRLWLTDIDSIEKLWDRPEFVNKDLRTLNLDQFLKDNNIRLQEGVLPQIRALQRIQRIHPDSTIGAALLAEKIHSSAQIHEMGPDRLVKALARQNISKTDAIEIFWHADTRYFQTLARALDFRNEMHIADPRVILNQRFSLKDKELDGGYPDLKVLFGSLDYCDCKHCQSVYGPGAYLTDILRYLDKKYTENGDRKIADVLLERRPDIGNVRLNCTNTETPLPYIDLVCEILENAIEQTQVFRDSRGPGDPVPAPAADFGFQTTLKPEELKAFPEHISTPAYNFLRTVPYPMNLSFDLWQEEARVFLQHLGISRYKLMENFQISKTITTDPPEIQVLPSDTSISGEFFGISSYETSIITTPHENAATLKEYWGIDPHAAEISVSDLLTHAKIEYPELLQLINVRWLASPQPAKTIVIERRPLDSCDTDNHYIRNLDLSIFDRIHRFLRLWRHTEWKMWELDLLIRASKIGNGRIDADTLKHLKQCRQVQMKLGLSFDELLSFFGRINTETHTDPDTPEKIVQPYFRDLFLNPASSGIPDPVFSSNLDPLIKLSNHKETLLAALAVTETEFWRLMEMTSDSLTIENLSHLLRYTILSRKMDLPIKDLLTLRKLTGITDLFSSPRQVLDFLRIFDCIKRSGFQVPELDYLLDFTPCPPKEGLPAEETDSPFGLREETIVQYIRALCDSLSLSEQNREQRVVQVCDTIAEKLSLPADKIPDLTKLLRSVSDDTKNEILSKIKTAFSVPDTAMELLATDITNFLTNLKNDRKNQVISHIATTFSVTNEQARLLLDMDISGDLLIDNLTSDELVEKIKTGSHQDDLVPEKTITNYTTAEYFKKIYISYSLLHKATILIKKSKISRKEDLEWLLKDGKKCKLLDFRMLPVTSKPAGAAMEESLFQAWYRLNKWIYFNALFPVPEKTSLRKIFNLAMSNPLPDHKEILENLSLLTTWKMDDLGELHTGLGIIHGDSHSAYTDIDTYLRLLKCMNQVKRIGVSAEKARSLADRDDNALQREIAQQIRQAAKSKYDYSSWLSILAPLQNELRERKRNALLRFLIENSVRTEVKEMKSGGMTYPNPRYWKTPEMLLGYFLIDVEMNACQMTSRIKQAISSAQMFVQRCFLNLEQPEVNVSNKEKADPSSEDSWRQWKWMKNYRVWEANRKVFLYPENWIEPELRDDKSYFFRELENELAQNEITDENVEAAFFHYLQKVHEVSRIEVVGAYHEQDDFDTSNTLDHDIDIFHVIGRTRSQPATYYYRRFDLNYDTWTAWEKIELDITGDHLIPVIYNRKLHLFWLIFLEKPQKVKKMPPAKISESVSDSPEPPKMLEIQLAWSVRKKDGWTAKKLSSQKIIHPWQRPQSSYNLKPRYKSRENLLWLDLYISQSLEFNNTRFYDPYRDTDNLQYLTLNRFDETAYPWHSSSFVFDGEVVDIKMRAINGRYHILSGDGLFSDYLTNTTSWNYVHDNFGDNGRIIHRMNGKYEIAPHLRLPKGMHYQNTHLVNNTYYFNPDSLNVIEIGFMTTLLTAAKAPFEMVFSQDRAYFDTARWTLVPFFYQDPFRAFFINPGTRGSGVYRGKIVPIPRYVFYPFYHPYTALFIRELNRSGIDGLLNRNIQVEPFSYYPGNTFSFSDAVPQAEKSGYGPTPVSVPCENFERDLVDFSQNGSYSIYNWELFFHAPFMIACRLSRNRKFEESMRWFHYIFDPTSTEGLGIPERYWITRPFYEQNQDDYRKQRIENLLKNISENTPQLIAWRNNPFKPHLIARYRPVAYQKAVVMKYIDNLIAWGDQLFSQDTIESINLATTLYILAYELLGPRPVKVPGLSHEELSYAGLTKTGDLDPFANKQLDVLMENMISVPDRKVRPSKRAEPVPHLIFYFCIPHNENLLEYWTRVEDRLFKIRHCMNIRGIVRQLPLFEPPLDPAILVKAAAAGMDLDSVLNDTGVSLGQYRYRVLVQKAMEFCSEVKALGDKLLSTLEKNDAEGLALLRSVNEIKMLEAVREVKKAQIKDAKETQAGLEYAKELAEKKKEYYGSKEFMNPGEVISALLTGGAIAVSTIQISNEISSALYHLMPDFTLGGSGAGGSPRVSVDWGSGNIARAAGSANSALGHVGSVLSQTSSLTGTISGYVRRKEEWDFQEQLAITELKQIERQIKAAEIKCMITEKELENHELQIEQTKSVDEYMHSKYTNQQLYDWMLSQIATLYFQSYQLAFDMAKRAERAYQFELGRPDTFIQFGYWDSLKKGLLSGERLAGDLRRMETSYLDMNMREFEITKHISLLQIAPDRLLDLKQKGYCAVSLIEELFDRDYPGHFRRRIKSVSFSIPCVTGPYTSVSCTISLTSNKIRTKDIASGNYSDATNFTLNKIPIQSIVTSTAQNDSGIFELSFNDERYLPFEGAGVISEWMINLQKDFPQFDYDTISDFIFHIRYTAAQGSTSLASTAIRNLKAAIPENTWRIFVLNHDFSSEWNKFLNHTPQGGGVQALEFILKPEHLPYYAQTISGVTLSRVSLLLEMPVSDGGANTYTVSMGITSPPPAAVQKNICTSKQTASKDGNDAIQWLDLQDTGAPDGLPKNLPVLGTWKITLEKQNPAPIRKEDIRNAFLLVKIKIPVPV